MSHVGKGFHALATPEMFRLHVFLLSASTRLLEEETVQRAWTCLHNGGGYSSVFVWFCSGCSILAERCTAYLLTRLFRSLDVS